VIVLVVYLVILYRRGGSQEGSAPQETPREKATMSGADGAFTLSGPEHLCKPACPKIEESKLWRAYFALRSSQQGSKRPLVAFSLVVERQERKAPYQSEIFYPGGTVEVRLWGSDPATLTGLCELRRGSNLPDRVEAGTVSGAQEKAFQTAEISALEALLSTIDLGAISALRHAKAVPTLLEAVVGQTLTQDEQVRAAAEKALVGVGAEAVAALTGALKSADAPSRVRLARVLGQVGRNAQEAVPALKEALGDTNGEVRIAAAVALVGIGPGSKEGLQCLAEALQGEDARTCVAAANALAKIGTAAESLRAALQKAATWEGSKHRGDVMLVAYRAWLAVNYAPGSGRTAFGPTQGERSWESSLALLAVVQKRHPDWPAPPPADAPEDKRSRWSAWVKEMQLKAIRDLGAMWGVAPEFFIALSDALKDADDPLVRREIAAALGNCQPSGIFPLEGTNALMSALKDADGSVRRAAAEALAKRAPAPSGAGVGRQRTAAAIAAPVEAIPALVAARKDDDAATRKAAAVALAKLAWFDKAALDKAGATAAETVSTLT
jgi:HEAT repeat protein